MRTSLPDAMSAFLSFNAGGYVQQGQRIDTRFRPPQERGPRTDDEWFQVQVFAPLVGFAVERGWVEPWEAQLTLHELAQGLRSLRARGFDTNEALWLHAPFADGEPLLSPLLMLYCAEDTFWEIGLKDTSTWPNS